MRDNNKRSQYRYKDKSRNRNRDRVSKRDKEKRTQSLSAKESIKLKLKQVFFPYLGLSILTILLYGILRWVFDIYLNILPLRDVYWGFGIPLFLSVLVISIWMWPRYSSLNLKWAQNSSASCFFITMVLALAAPFIISQSYLSKAAYEIVKIESLNETRDYPKQKYFRVDNFKLLKSEHVFYADTHVSGRYNEDFKVNYYLATPFAEANNIWLGLHYYINLDNRLSDSTKNSEYLAFINDSIYRDMNKDLGTISYFRKIKSADDRSSYLHAMVISDERHELPAVILVPETTPFIESLERDLVWGFGSFIIGMGVCLLLILVADIGNQEKKGIRKHIQKQKHVKKRAPVSDLSKSLVALFRSNKKRPATLVLMLICIGAFILSVLMGMDIINPLSRQIDQVGGLTTDALQAGKYWRVVTSLFVHEGIMHLAMSLGMLFAAGYILEPVLGAVRFTMAFLICGIFANVLGVLYYDMDMAGAWGAIFGLFGIAMALIAYKVFNKKYREIYGATVAVILTIVLSSMFVEFINTLSYMAYYLLTLCFGLVFGVIMVMTQKQFLLGNARHHNI